MTTEERERIRSLARARAGELLSNGLMVRKAAQLRTLGWPEVVREQQRKAS